MKTEKKLVELNYYYTEDGASFTSESRAFDHEKELNKRKIEKEFHKTNGHFSIHIFDLELDEWYMISNKEQLEYVNIEYRSHYLNDYNGNYSKLIVGDWVCVVDAKNDDMGNIYTLKYLLNKMSDFVNDVENKTVNGQF